MRLKVEGTSAKEKRLGTSAKKKRLMIIENLVK